MNKKMRIIHSNKDMSEVCKSSLVEGRDFIFISKPSGLLVHSAEYMKPDEQTLVDLLLKDFPQIADVGDDTKYRPGIVHRLDRETSGIMVIALNQNTFLYLKKLFSEHKIKKTYKAIVSGKMKDSDIVDMPIGIKKGTIKRTVFSNKMAKDATTKFINDGTFKKNSEIFSFISAYPLTGRTHQIRVHLNYIHHPVIGDSFYGGKRNKDFASRLMLHSYSIEFKSQNGELMHCKSDLPDDFLNFLPLNLRSAISS